MDLDLYEDERMATTKKEKDFNRQAELDRKKEHEFRAAAKDAKPGKDESNGSPWWQIPGQYKEEWK